MLNSRPPWDDILKWKINSIHFKPKNNSKILSIYIAINRYTQLHVPGKFISFVLFRKLHHSTVATAILPTREKSENIGICATLSALHNLNRDFPLCRFSFNTSSTVLRILCDRCIN